MISSDIKSIVAQNCPEFEPKSTFAEMSMADYAGNCNHCSNLKGGKCTKDLLEGMAERISRN